MCIGHTERMTSTRFSTSCSRSAFYDNASHLGLGERGQSQYLAGAVPLSSVMDDQRLNILEWEVLNLRSVAATG